MNKLSTQLIQLECSIFRRASSCLAPSLHRLLTLHHGISKEAAWHPLCTFLSRGVARQSMRISIILFYVILSSNISLAGSADRDSSEIPLLKPRYAIKVPGKENEVVPSLKPRKKVATGGRSLASIDETPARTFEAAKPSSQFSEDSDSIFRIGALGGVSTLSSADAPTQSAIQNGGSASNIYLGMNADYRWRWIGAEADGFYGLVPSQGSNAGVTSLQQFGGLINAKVQTNIYFLGLKWIPKAGLGVGLMGLQENSVSNAGSPTGTYEAMGVFGVLGFDVEPTKSVLVQMDYARSFLASGTFAGSGSTIGASSAEFDRFRLGAYYRVWEPVYVGAQLMLRSMNIIFPATVSPNNQQDSQTQILGTVMLQL
jgi:hypothetical protein